MFLYSFNAGYDRVEAYFRGMKPDMAIRPMSLRNVIEALAEDQAAGRRVVVVTPASPNFDFGEQQMRMLAELQRRFPVIGDVFSVGHCLFG